MRSKGKQRMQKLDLNETGKYKTNIQGAIKLTDFYKL
jgi:hypothetical protein